MLKSKKRNYKNKYIINIKEIRIKKIPSGDRKLLITKIKTCSNIQCPKTSPYH